MENPGKVILVSDLQKVYRDEDHSDSFHDDDVERQQITKCLLRIPTWFAGYIYTPITITDVNYFPHRKYYVVNYTIDGINGNNEINNYYNNDSDPTPFYRKPKASGGSPSKKHKKRRIGGKTSTRKILYSRKNNKNKK